MQSSIMVLAALLTVTGPPAKASLDSIPPLEHCLVSLVSQGEAKVPAREPGALVEIAVAEGQAVKAGDLLARVDDVEAGEAARAAEFEVQVAAAEQKAAREINVPYSKKACAVAEAEYRSSEEANTRVSGTVSRTDMRRLLLTWQRSALEIEKAEADLKIAGLKLKVAEAKAKAAREKFDKHQIRSPIDGVVVEIRPHVGEWVQPPIQPSDEAAYVVRVVGVDRLRIEGFLKVGEVNPWEIADRPVTATVEFARGRKESFRGQIVFVSPQVGAGREYRFWAEVVNRQLNGQWLLRPGHTAEMTIQIK